MFCSDHRWHTPPRLHSSDCCGRTTSSDWGCSLRTMEASRHPKDKDTWWVYMGRLMTKTTKWLCAQRRLRSASVSAQWVAKDPSFLHVDSEDLIRQGGCSDWSESSLGAHAILLVLSWGVSYVYFWIFNMLYSVPKTYLYTGNHTSQFT